MTSVKELVFSFFRVVSFFKLKEKPIIHFVLDEKFIDFAYNEFESVKPNSNVFIKIGLKKELKFINQARITFIHPRILWFISPYFYFFSNAIIFHSIPNAYCCNLILRINPKIKIFWISWGFDLINLFGDKSDYLKKETTKFVLSKKSAIHLSNSGCISYRKATKVLPSKKLLISKINYISTVIDSEFQILENSNFPNLPKFIPWNYLTLENDIVSKFSNFEIKGNKIMLGNSSNIWNNHLEALDDILSFNFSFDEIICPLSYGDFEYRDSVLTKGKALFGNKFYPLLNFMPYGSYVNELLSCKYYFINSKRQLALGNILLMLYLGSFVILDSSSVLYSFFKNSGIQVFTIDDAKNNKFQPIDLVNTRMVLKKIWGKDKIRLNTINLIKLI